MALRALLLLSLTGCTLVTDSFLTNDFSGDPFPIQVETHSGAIVLGMSQDGGATQIAVLDVMSPMTVTDPGTDVSPSVAFSQIQLLGELSRSGTFTVPRALLDDAQVLSLHPCASDAAECDIGPGSAPRPFEAIIGADGLAGDALRLNLSTDEIYLLADVAGSDAERTYACDAVFDSPYRGGGTLVLAGTELPFGSRRVALDACLAPNPIASLPQSQRGADVLLVASTAVGPSLISESAYERYRQSELGAPPALETLTDDTVFLPSGLVTGKRAVLPALALVGNSTSNPRAPCRQVWAHHLMAEGNCVEGDDCPCPGDFSGSPVLRRARHPRARAVGRHQHPGPAGHRSDAASAARRAPPGSGRGRRHPRPRCDAARPDRSRLPARSRARALQLRALHHPPPARERGQPDPDPALPRRDAAAVG